MVQRLGEGEGEGEKGRLTPVAVATSGEFPTLETASRAVACLRNSTRCDAHSLNEISLIFVCRRSASVRRSRQPAGAPVSATRRSFSLRFSSNRNISGTLMNLATALPIITVGPSPHRRKWRSGTRSQSISRTARCTCSNSQTMQLLRKIGAARFPRSTRPRD